MPGGDEHRAQCLPLRRSKPGHDGKTRVRSHHGGFQVPSAPPREARNGRSPFLCAGIHPRHNKDTEKLCRLGAVAWCRGL